MSHWHRDPKAECSLHPQRLELRKLPTEHEHVLPWSLCKQPCKVFELNGVARGPQQGASHPGKIKGSPILQIKELTKNHDVLQRFLSAELAYGLGIIRCKRIRNQKQR